MVEWLTYPVYPTVDHVTVHCLSQSTASSSSSSSSPIDVFTWRGLVPQETDLADRLQKLPAQFLPERFVAVLQSENSEGRAAQERGDWKTAMAKFETCRTMISEDLRKLVPEHVEGQDVDLLLAWADLPLAELYQSRGSSDSVMLKKAMDMRKEVLRCVTWILGSSFWPRGDNPLPTNIGIGSFLGDSLVQVCVTYYYTAQYEWGRAVNNERARTEAIQKFANFVGCGDDEAESQLCLLLSVDYQYLGRFEVGLEWIEEADRHWPQISAGVDKYRRILRLSKAELLIKVEKFAEARKTLEELEVSEHDRKHPLGCPRRRVQSTCYSQMSRRAACTCSVDQAKDYERQAREYDLEGFEPDVRSSRGVEFPPMLKATPWPLGSSLGLGQESDIAVFSELRKLPVVQANVLLLALRRGLLARERRDWEAATYWYERTRELLKLTARAVETQTYEWLLSWLNLTLAHFYQYHTRKLEKALMTWVDLLLASASHEMGSADEFMSHRYHCHLAAVLFEGSGEVLNQPYHVRDGSKACGTDRYTSERHSCFWLYFDHHRARNYDTSLHWIRESKRLKEEHISLCSDVDCPERTCSDDDYFCCDYDYLRCEADLLMKLEKFKEAITVLEKLLRTRHVQRGSRLLARQARKRLHRCRASLGILAERVTDRMETSSAVDNEHGNGTAEKLPSTFGCVREFDHQMNLAQSQVGLEHHLHQLPVPLHVAFRWHGNRGNSFLKHHQLEATIFEFEWCRELLEITRGMQSSEAEQVEACDWLMVWASVPLANIYEFSLNQIKRGSGLWAEIARIIWKVNRHCPSSGDLDIKDCALSLYFVGRYHCILSEYKEDPAAVKDEVVRACGGFFRAEADREILVLKAKLINLLYMCGNYEAALPLIREMILEIDQGDVITNAFPGFLGDDVLIKTVWMECRCLEGLRRFEDAAKVLHNFIAKINSKADNLEKLPERVQKIRKHAICHASILELAKQRPDGINDSDILKYYQDMGPDDKLNQLRMGSLKFSMNGEMLKAVACYEERCVELIDKTCKEQLEGALDCELGAMDYFCLANWRAGLIKETISSCSFEQIKAYFQDVNFLRTLKYYKKARDLRVPTELGESTWCNLRMVFLYDIVDAPYWEHVLRLIAESIEKSLRLWCATANEDDLVDLHDRVRVQAGLFFQDCRDMVLGNYTGHPLPIQDAIKEIQTYLNFGLPIEKYGEQAISHLLSNLHNMDSISAESWWLRVLHQYRNFFLVLQIYHIRRVCAFARLQFDDDSFQKEIESSTWKAFMYAGAERTQLMLYQQHLVSKKLESSQQWGDDARKVRTVEDLQKLCKTVREGRSVYVQYDLSGVAYESLLIFIIDQDGKLSMSLGGSEKGTRIPNCEGGTSSAAVKKPRGLKKRLDNLYRYLDNCNGYDPKYNGESMKKDLTFLHELLIKPIADVLEKMKPEDNLILCPSEFLTKVPFAALRDFENSEEYLIELHTISLVPSLRVLHSCTERLIGLQRSHASTSCAGSIIALGDPIYTCPTCKKKDLQRLDGTGDEVNHIAKLFGENTVKKLLGQNATKEQFLTAAKPSDDSNCFGQAIVHVGAHGTICDNSDREEIDEELNEKILSLHLSCGDPTSSAKTVVPSNLGDTSLSHEESTSEPPQKRHTVESDDEESGVQSLSDDTSSCDEESPTDKYGKEHEVESDDNSEEDWTNSYDEDSDDEEEPLNLQSMFKKYPSFQETRQGASSSRSSAKIRRNASTTSQSVDSHALKVEDLSSFEWRAELVVLSSCLTARGRITFDGVLSFSRAFMIAGVPCVVASQWRVHDGATVPLMKVFYDELHQGKNVASALRSSMLAHMRTNRDSVGQWAAFNVWGVSSLRLREDLLDPDRPREHPMSASPLEADLAGGERNKTQFLSTDGGKN